MKKILFFILTTTFCSAQHPDLINTDWQITKYVNELGPDKLPPPMPYQQVTTFTTTNPQLHSSFFNSVIGELTYDGNQVFTVNSRGCTLADYMGDSGEVNQFFGLICAFFESQGNFHYFIINNGPQKTMIIGNSIFQEVHFASSNLGTINADLSEFILAPNPIKNILTVKNSITIKTFQIFDRSGKLILEKKNENTKSLNIDMQNFKTGIYFIKLNNDKTYQIIKK